MVDTTPRLKLPFMSTAQVQKELTFNELAAMADTLIGLTIIDKDLTVAPVSPAEGDAYIVAPAATGVWAGKSNHIAYYVGGWHFIEPQPGFLPWVSDEGSYYRYNEGTSTWVGTLVVAAEYLGELLDVDATSGPAVDGYALTWDDAAGFFNLKPVASALVNLSDVEDADLADGRVLAWDAGTSKFVLVDQTAATGFTALSDTPATFASAGGFYVRVNGTEDGLEFVDPGEGGGGGFGGGGAFTDLSDVPLSYASQAGKVPVVNEAEDGLEFSEIAAIAQGVPAGGSTHQVLRKSSDENFETDWVDPADIGTDFPALPGNARKKLVVTEDAVGVEWREDVYSVPMGFALTPGDAEVLLVHVFAEAVDFANDWAGSQHYVGVPPAAPYVVTINKISGGVTTAVGTVTISALGVATFVTTGDAVSFAIGDVMMAIGQALADGSIANTALTFKGART